MFEGLSDTGVDAVGERAERVPGAAGAGGGPRRDVLRRAARRARQVRAHGVPHVLLSVHRHLLEHVPQRGAPGLAPQVNRTHFVIIVPMQTDCCVYIRRITSRIINFNV